MPIAVVTRVVDPDDTFQKRTSSTSKDKIYQLFRYYFLAYFCPPESITLIVSKENPWLLLPKRSTYAVAWFENWEALLQVYPDCRAMPVIVKSTGIVVTT